MRPPRSALLIYYSTALTNNKSSGISEFYTPHVMPEAAPEHVQAPAPAELAFTVRRRGEPELVGPAALTPRETKRLSDIDDQDTLRGHVPFFFLYRGAHAAAGRDPAGVIRRALGGALVPFYPLAGRLREVEARKLVVDCTGEGVLFVEADADVRLEELQAPGHALCPPFPCMDQLLADVDGDGSGAVLHSPLLLIQVTRLLCGGFVLALRLNHTICDAIGLAQFMSTMSELARGLPAPTVSPAWSRELLEARHPPKPTFPHREFDAAPPPPPPPPGEMVTRTFTFTPSDVAAIKRGLPPKLRATATSFEALTAALWRARTAALAPPPYQEARLVCVVNFRGVPALALPAGYYGNACVPVAAPLTTAGVLLESSPGDAVALVRAAKAAVTAEYVRSTVDLLALRGRPCVALANLFLVSDNRRAGFRRLDFGWGEPAYGGPAATVFGVSFFAHAGSGGEDVAVLIALPRPALDRFALEVETLLKG
ncbi:hypothetical protein U9M48_041873 [Paspalum notatum var. saurae]|uniref:Benzyl alcohol O-benzoyltransferase n=1 Tax=Paspalum notatum var. saurae TaxID=547442 RepID=A0AAQ3XFP4_PASNO